MTETKLPILWDERKTENVDPNSHFGLSLNYISSHFDFVRRFRLQMICIFKFRHDRTNVYNWEGLQTYIMESCLVANFCETEFQLGILKMTLIPVPARLDSDSEDQNTIERRWLKQKIISKKSSSLRWFSKWCSHDGALEQSTLSAHRKLQRVWVNLKFDLKDFLFFK